MDRLHDPAFQRRKASVQLLQLFTAEARRFAVHMEQAVHAYELTGVPPSGPLWKATPGKAAKLSVAAASQKAEQDPVQRLNPFSVFIEERRQLASGDGQAGNSHAPYSDVVQTASAEWNMMTPDQQQRYQDVCWAGQTLEGALAELAGDRLGLASLSGELAGVSPIDLRAEPVAVSQPMDFASGDTSLRQPQAEPEPPKKRPRGRPPSLKTAQKKAATAAAKAARRDAQAAAADEG